jgi:hypothetical protein
MVGKIIAWNTSTQRGLIEDNLSGSVVRFEHGHYQDRQFFKEGMPVTFDFVDDTGYAVDVESATGAFKRFAG